MKKLYTLLAAVILTTTVFAQAPEKISYQAVIRDAGNTLVANQTVGMQLSILQGSFTGPAVYVETQTPTSNINGLVSLEIGSGVTLDNFSTIDWSNGPYFIKTETDPTGGVSYSITGTSELLSVPYALHAKTADSIVGGVSLTETDPIFGASISSGITSIDTANWNNHTIDTDTQLDSAGVATLGYEAGPHTTDTQLDSADISNLGYVAGPHTIDNDTQLDSSAIANMGYITSFIETDPVFGASISSGITALDTANWNNHTVDTDTQLDSAGVATLGFEAGPHTTDTQLDSVDISNLGYVAGPHTIDNDTQLDSLAIANMGYITSFTEIDADSTNELQALSISNDTIFLAGGGFVKLPAATGDSDWAISGNNQYSAVSGNVGIGTTNPTSKLHITTNTTPGIYINNSGSATSLFNDLSSNGGIANYSYFNGKAGSGFLVDSIGGDGWGFSATVNTITPIVGNTISGAAFAGVQSGRGHGMFLKHNGVQGRAAEISATNAANTDYTLVVTNKGEGATIFAENSITTPIGAIAVGQFQYSGSNNFQDHIGVSGSSVPTAGVGIGVQGTGGFYGVHGIGGDYGVFSTGNSGATGTKSFVIDHPQDPENKILRHFSMESNEVLNVYRGVATLNSNGEIKIELPDYFEAINIEFSYQLTAIGTPQQPYILEEITNNKFTIAGKPNSKVSWMVLAKRNDPYVKQNPRSVTNIVEKGKRAGKYLMPELYGKPETESFDYVKKMPR